MATAPTDESVLLFQLLSDGRWHSYPLIKDAIARRVSPGRALRAYEVRMKPERDKRNDPSYNTCRTDDEKIDFGKQDVAQQTVSSWTGRGIQSWGKRDKRIIRVVQGFESFRLARPAVPPEDDQFAPGAYLPGEEPPAGVERPLHPPRRPGRDEAEGEGVEPQPVEALMSPLEDPVGVEVGQGLLGAPEGSGGPSVAPSGVGELPGALEPVGVSAGLGVAEDVVAYAGPVPGEREPELGYDGSLLSVTADEVLASFPACPECGVPVRDALIHKDWHGRLEASRTSAEPVLMLSQFKKILDEFQVGMQTWELRQFAQLEAKITNRAGAPARWRDGSGKRPSH